MLAAVTRQLDLLDRSRRARRCHRAAGAYRYHFDYTRLRADLSACAPACATTSFRNAPSRVIPVPLAGDYTRSNATPPTREAPAP